MQESEIGLPQYQGGSKTNHESYKIEIKYLQQTFISQTRKQQTISAKEKTGVDPLSQVSIPLNSIKGQTNIIDTSNMNPSHPNRTGSMHGAPRAKKSIGASWTDHRTRPPKSKFFSLITLI